MKLTPAHLIYLEGEPYIMSEDNSTILANTNQLAVTRVDGIVEIDPKLIDSLLEEISQYYGKCYIETIDEFINPEFFTSVGWGEGKPLVNFVNGKVVIYAREIDFE
jgi:predicted P-loop ATPase/GTPase